MTFVVRELVVAYRSQTIQTQVPYGTLLATPHDVALLAAALETSPGVRFDEEPCEVAAVLALSTKHHLLAFHVLSRGSLDTTPVHPREVLRVGLLTNAAGLILVHSHPSGDPTPSPDDEMLTKRVRQAGEVVGVAVLDHMILGHDGRYFSFLERGRLKDV